MNVEPVKKRRAPKEKSVRIDERRGICGLQRDWLCRKQGNLTSNEVENLTRVTFLTAAEVRNIEMLFELLVETMNARGTLATVTRVSTAVGEPTRQRKVVALTTQQIQDHLAEFSHNVFFERLVRVFSESGEQKLTLLELIDLYSAMSPRANLHWKTRVAYCVYDFDEVSNEHPLLHDLITF